MCRGRKRSAGPASQKAECEGERANTATRLVSRVERLLFHFVFVWFCFNRESLVAFVDRGEVAKKREGKKTEENV